MLVKQILASKGEGAETSAQIVTIRPDATIGDAVNMLSEHRIGAVVVSSDGARPEGILSERDIVRAMAANDSGLRARPVSDLMTSSVSTCSQGEDALTVLERMTEGRFRHLPVVDDQGQMLGIISIGDAVSARLKELAAEKDALTGMIMGA